MKAFVYLVCFVCGSAFLSGRGFGDVSGPEGAVKTRVSRTDKNWLRTVDLLTSARTEQLPTFDKVPTEAELCAMGLPAACPAGLKPIAVQMPAQQPGGAKAISFSLVPENVDLTQSDTVFGSNVTVTPALWDSVRFVFFRFASVATMDPTKPWKWVVTLVSGPLQAADFAGKLGTKASMALNCYGLGYELVLDAGETALLSGSVVGIELAAIPAAKFLVALGSLANSADGCGKAAGKFVENLVVENARIEAEQKKALAEQQERERKYQEYVDRERHNQYLRGQPGDTPGGTWKFVWDPTKGWTYELVPGGY